MDNGFGTKSGVYSMSSESTLSNGGGGGRRLCCWQLFSVFIFAVGIVGGILIGIYAFHGGPDKEFKCEGIDDIKEMLGMKDDKMTTADPGSPTTMKPMTTTPKTDEECKQCRKEDPVKAWDGDDPEIFAPLTAEEMQNVHDYLLRAGIVSERTGDVNLKSNYDTYMYLFLPNKQQVKKYLAGTGLYPGRYARVHVVRGARNPPDYMEYKVGPLQGGQMAATQLYNDEELVFNSRPYDYVETALYEQLVIPDFRILEKLTKESFDGAYHPNGGLQFWFFNGPPGAEADKRETRFLIFFNPFNNGYDITELDFLPLTGTIHCPGTNMSEWYMYDYYYLNQGPYATAKALMDDYNAGNIRTFVLPKGYRDTVKSRAFPNRDINKPFRENAHMQPPRAYEPEGARYSVRGHTVDWMGWSFSITSGQLRGPGLFNVKFKGESIAYEISLNDIGVIYGSDASAQTNVVYTDSSYGIGEYYGVVPGVDCPEHASLLETSHWDVYLNKPVVHKSICVYEADAQSALWRHKGLEFEAGLRNNFLVLRLSATIDNYDYIVEWHFYLDGKIYTIMSASGYIQGAFWDADNPHMGSDKSRDAFGFRVSDYTHGQMHDHMFGFKVDMDLIDANNSFEVIHWKVGDVMTALKSQVPSFKEYPAYFLHNITRYLQYETVEREAAYRINMDEPKFWTVVNENYRNKWGVKRGYQIKPFTTAAQTLDNSHPALPALSFTRHHCTVTKRKENEQYLTSTSDINRFDKPIEDLESKLDGEYIRNEDIVNWVTVGFLHLPTSEDVPMTNRVESGFMLKPFNFFDKTESFDMPQYTDTEHNTLTERPPEMKSCLERKVKTCTFC